MVFVGRNVCWRASVSVHAVDDEAPPATRHKRAYEHLTLSSAVPRCGMYHFLPMTATPQQWWAWTTSGWEKSCHGRWQIKQLLYIWNWFLERHGRIQVNGVTHLNWYISNSKMIKSDGFSRRRTIFIMKTNLTTQIWQSSCKN